MSHLVRFLKNSALWTDIDESAGVTLKSSWQLLFDIVTEKGAGASYWEIDPNKPESLKRAIAAYASSQSAFNGLNLGVLPMTDVARLNINAKKSTAKNADSNLGQNSHYDVTMDSIEQAIATAEIIRKSFRSIPKIQVQQNLLWSVGRGNITIHDMNDKLLKLLAEQHGVTLQRIAGKLCR